MQVSQSVSALVDPCLHQLAGLSMLLSLTACAVHSPAIHWRAARGENAEIERLLRAGHNVNEIDDDGRSALHIAARCGHVGTVQLLIALGASVSSADSLGAIPLHYAVDADKNAGAVTKTLLESTPRSLLRTAARGAVVKGSWVCKVQHNSSRNNWEFQCNDWSPYYHFQTVSDANMAARFEEQLRTPNLTPLLLGLGTCRDPDAVLTLIELDPGRVAVEPDSPRFFADLVMRTFCWKRDSNGRPEANVPHSGWQRLLERLIVEGVPFESVAISGYVAPYYHQTSSGNFKSTLSIGGSRGEVCMSGVPGAISLEEYVSSVAGSLPSWWSVARARRGR